ncbi:MAG: hypothetical protein CMJ64_20090 [Planctomycetaceae bacterium]|nr:hypothetical protein [Planctomycetaceae bacterium]
MLGPSRQSTRLVNSGLLSFFLPMDQVKKKVLLDLFASPMTVLPIAGGLSAWMLSWAIDGSMLLNLGGLVGVLGGCGLLATRLIIGLDKITERAYEYLHEQEREDQEEKLDRLRSRLCRDNDPRTQTYLRTLRDLYDGLQEDVASGKLTRRAGIVLGQVDKLFQAAVKHFEHSYHLWKTEKHLSGAARQNLNDEREQVIQEVKETVEHLGRTIEQFHSFRVKENEAELAKLREELDETMQVARRAEERVAALDDERAYSEEDYE